MFRSFSSLVRTQNIFFLSREEIMERTLSVISHFDKVDAQKVTEDCNFNTDLGLDSLESTELVVLIEEEVPFLYIFSF